MKQNLSKSLTRMNHLSRKKSSSTTRNPTRALTLNHRSRHSINTFSHASSVQRGFRSSQNRSIRYISGASQNRLNQLGGSPSQLTPKSVPLPGLTSIPFLATSNVPRHVRNFSGLPLTNTNATRYSGLIVRKNTQKCLISKSKESADSFLHSNPSRRFFSTITEGMMIPRIEVVRSLVEMRKSGTLTTISTDPEDSEMPLFGSVCPYILSKDGNPIFPLRTTEKHFSHLKKYAKSSLTVFPLTPAHLNPAKLHLPRINLVGMSLEINKEDVFQRDIFDRFVEVHPTFEEPWQKEKDAFRWFQLQVSQVKTWNLNQQNPQEDSKSIDQKIDTFDPVFYATATSDPVTKALPQILTKLEFNKHSFFLFVKEYIDPKIELINENCFIWFMDRFGFNLFAQDVSGVWTDYRFPFPTKMTNPDLIPDAISNSLQELNKKWL